MNETVDNEITSGIILPSAESMEKNPPPHFTRADIICALMMIPAGYLCVKLVLSSGLGLGVTVFTLLFAAALVYWFCANKVRLAPESLAYLALILLIAAYFTLYDNSLLKILALLLLPLLTGYFIATAGNIRLQAQLGPYLPFDLGDTLLARPFADIGVLPRLLHTKSLKSAKSQNIALLLLGLALSIPVCLVLISLLQSADAAFSALWRRLMDLFFSSAITNILQFLISLPLACYFFAVLYGGKKPRRDVENAHKLAEKLRFLPNLLVIGGITPMLLIYVTFFLAQTAYFLSAFSGLLPQGYIYSEYARRGFFELCAVSGVNLAAIFTLMFLSKKSAGNGLLYRIYTVLLSLFSLALIAISLRKMLLYIQIYGLTPLRVYTSWTMLLLALFFLFIIVKTWRPRFNAAKWSAIATVSMFLILCFANPDMQIARYNVRAYSEGRLPTVDVELLEYLGDAAVPYLLEITT
ncbi:MAG: DUF4173 domain-containing protein, partial [Clostridiales bacterium]|nr:DUF4173 domain-containing protein [Clostridiales bacterium]